MLFIIFSADPSILVERQTGSVLEAVILSVESSQVTVNQ